MGSPRNQIHSFPCVVGSVTGREGYRPSTELTVLPINPSTLSGDAPQCALTSTELALWRNVLVLIRENDLSLAGDNNDLSNGCSGFCGIGGRWRRCRPIDRAVAKKAGDELYDIVGSDFGKRW
jgi:hypothetical protein